MEEVDYLIERGSVVDGSGSPARQLDIAVRADRIVAVDDDLSQIVARERIDATGCVVAPGIIDIHSHADWTLSVDGTAESAVLQGISTIVPGQCGHGVAPVGNPSLLRLCAFGLDRETDAEVTWRSFGEWMNRLRDGQPTVNIVPLAAHGAIRIATMGASVAPAGDDEIQLMRAHVEDAMEAGAAGISTGLEYQPGQSVSQAELVLVAEVAGAHDGIYATHCRNRTSRIEQAAVEAIGIAIQARCRLQLSHFLPRPYARKDAFERSLARMEQARQQGVEAYCDTHPHLIGPGPIAQMLPGWAWQKGPHEMAELLRDVQWRQRVLKDLDPRMREYLNSGVADRMLIIHAPGSEEMVGATLGEIARQRKTKPEEVALDLMRDAKEDFYTVTELETWATREDMDRIVADESFMLMGDGLTLSRCGKLSKFHFSVADWNWVPELLYEQVMKRGVTSIESAIRRMTSLPAQQLGLKHVGELRTGWRADVVVFEPCLMPYGQAIADDPMQVISPMGSCVRLLLVNGAKTVEKGKITDARAGRVGRT